MAEARVEGKAGEQKPTVRGPGSRSGVGWPVDVRNGHN